MKTPPFKPKHNTLIISIAMVVMINASNYLHADTIKMKSGVQFENIRTVITSGNVYMIFKDGHIKYHQKSKVASLRRDNINWKSGTTELPKDKDAEIRDALGEGFFTFNSLSIKSPYKTRPIIIETADRKCTLIDTFQQWYIFFGTIPVYTADTKEIFKSPDQAYRIRERATWSDALITIFTGFLTTMSKKTIEVEKCEGGIYRASKSQIDSYIAQQAERNKDDFFVRQKQDITEKLVNYSLEEKLEKQVVLLLKSGEFKNGKLIEFNEETVTIENDEKNQTISRQDITGLKIPTIDEQKPPQEIQDKGLIEPKKDPDQSLHDVKSKTNKTKYVKGALELKIAKEKTSGTGIKTNILKTKSSLNKIGSQNHES